MIPLLVLRPEPGAAATAERARGTGLSVVAAPLFELVALPPSPTEAPFDALLLTSAAAVRFSEPMPAAWRHRPVYAVGSATAAAARARGLQVVHVGTGDAEAASRAAAGDGHRCLLHPCGRDRAEADVPLVQIIHLPVYEAIPATVLPDALAEPLERGAVAMIHSSRAGTLFAQLAEEARVDRGRTHIVAISDRALAAAGTGWASGQAAAAPDDGLMLVLAAPLCQEQTMRQLFRP